MHEQLEEILGVKFQDPKLLRLALTHRSYIYETPGVGQSSNERLEFLGDSILALISADFLYRTFPDLSEGELTDVRAVLVRTETLAKFANEINLGKFLLMGKGEQHSGADNVCKPQPLKLCWAQSIWIRAWRWHDNSCYRAWIH
ncbi:ribonuclease III family protein [Dictyobacter kobayashii]|uniref:Ribonuclease 3 n=1 Tax=Dictyobacter kobayashii TaxID=2014872 RepID=A0A402ANA0_9CHLR|nr:ribonuclease III domain-containing protein [Dictyobacter kobayashii]GCE20504.1 hypothetical protein KDK_43040 [Dictyobacter kobayashii]